MRRAKFKSSGDFTEYTATFYNGIDIPGTGAREDFASKKSRTTEVNKLLDSSPSSCTKHNDEFPQNISKTCQELVSKCQKVHHSQTLTTLEKEGQNEKYHLLKGDQAETLKILESWDSYILH